MPFREQLAKSIEKGFLKRPGVQRIAQKTGPAYAIGDDVFAFISDDGIVVRLEDAERSGLLHAPNARPYHPEKPGARNELVELVLNSFMDVMTGIEWVRRAYSEAANRAAKAKPHRKSLFSK
jgi:hypothetical protein